MAGAGDFDPTFDFGSFAPSIGGSLLAMQDTATGVHDMAHAVEPAIKTLNGPFAVIEFGRLGIDFSALTVMEQGLEDLTREDSTLGNDEKRAAALSGRVVTLALAGCSRLGPALRDMDQYVMRSVTGPGYATASDPKLRSERRNSLRGALPPVKRFTEALDLGLNLLYPHNRNPRLAQAALLGGYARLLCVTDYDEAALLAGRLALPEKFESLSEAYDAINHQENLSKHAEEALALAEQLPLEGGLPGFIFNRLDDDYMGPLTLSASLARVLNGQARTIEDHERARDIVAGCDAVLLAHMLCPISKFAMQELGRDDLAQHLPKAIEMATNEADCNSFKRKLRDKEPQSWDLYLKLGGSIRTRVLAKDPLLSKIGPEERLPDDLDDKYRVRIVNIRLGNHIALSTLDQHLMSTEKVN